MTALLTISDGTTEVDLLAPGDGFHLLRWIRNIVDFKGGGVFQDSPLAEGRRLVHASRANGIETFQVRANAINQNELLELEQDLFSLLQTAIDFWTGVTSTPVYISAKGNNEDNTRYAIIHNWRIPQLPSQFEAPFLQPGCLSALGEFDLILERGNWLSNTPGTGTAALINTLTEDYSYTAEWDTDTTSTGEVQGFAEKTSNTDLYAAAEADVLKSTDDGASWAVSDSAVTDSEAVLVSTAGDIFAGDAGRIRVSTNDGAAWADSTTAPTTTIHFLYQTSNGDIWAGGNLEGFYTTDDGAVWNAVPGTLTPGGDLYAMVELTNGDYLMTDERRVWRSQDSGATWAILATPYPGDGIRIRQLANGDVLILGSNQAAFRSTDNGVTWKDAFPASASAISGAPDGDIIQAAGGELYMLTLLFLGGIGVSFDNGNSWGAENITIGAITAGGLFEAANGYVYAGSDGNIYRKVPAETDMGMSLTASGFVANKWNFANLTHVKTFDNSAGTYTDIFPLSGFPVDLFDAAKDAADITYFGINETVYDEGVFLNLIFDIITPAVGLTLNWEYWNGAWTALTISDLTGVLSFLGLNSISWNIESDWAKTAVDGITGFWVRADIGSWGVASAATVPQQQNINVFSAITNFIEIPASQLGGDIPPLLGVKVENLSDDGSNLQSPANRVIVGARSVSRGAFFVSHLNASDQQKPFGIAVAAGANTAFTDASDSITGRLATYNPTGAESIAARITWSIDAGVGKGFYGRYRIFFRGQETSGSAGDIEFRVVVTTGAGGIAHTGDNVTFPNLNIWQLADMGVFDIPASQQVDLDETVDTVVITLQASSPSTTPNLLIHDIVLIPVDEWSGDFVDTVDSAASEIRNGFLLDINSITNPKIGARSMLTTTSGFVSGIYQPILNDKVIVPATDAAVRFYFLNAALTSSAWESLPTILSKITMQTTKRYYSGRGTN